MVGDERGACTIRFDLFELDARSCQLRRNGLPVDLPPQALQLLVLLAERPEELVSRDEIKARLWPGQSYGDFDSRLNFAVKKLREALGDDAEQPRYVQTVRKAGYRFIVPLRRHGLLGLVLAKAWGLQPAGRSARCLSWAEFAKPGFGEGDFKLGEMCLSWRS